MKFLLALLFVSNALACPDLVPVTASNITILNELDLGLSQEEFNRALASFQDFYSPLAAEHGFRLEIRGDWNDDRVNAKPHLREDVWEIVFFGGYARHELATRDAVTALLCHELGHFLGGAPHYYSPEAQWASSEGQADYFASLKCLRKIWKSENNAEVVAKLNVPELVKRKCAETFSDLNQQSLCMRSAMSGQAMVRIFSRFGTSNFETPNLYESERTFEFHPGTQCRLDTFFQGALCEVSEDIDVSPTDYRVGTCFRSQGDQIGVRPRCWFNPMDDERNR